MMLNYIDKLFLGQHYSKAPLASFLIVLSIFTGVAAPALTKELTKVEQYKILLLGEDLSKNTYEPKGKLPQKDGIYLYGQSAEPQQIGQEYIVIEVSKGKAVGAFYLPSSEFNCFNGTIEAGKLALLLANGPETEAYPDTIGSNTQEQQVAIVGDRSLGENSSNELTTPYSVALQNYHQLPQVSDSDKQILAACKSNYQDLSN
jgi:hypothetical protein